MQCTTYTYYMDDDSMLHLPLFHVPRFTFAMHTKADTHTHDEYERIMQKFFSFFHSKVK